MSGVQNAHQEAADSRVCKSLKHMLHSHIMEPGDTKPLVAYKVMPYNFPTAYTRSVVSNDGKSMLTTTQFTTRDGRIRRAEFIQPYDATRLFALDEHLFRCNAEELSKKLIEMYAEEGYY
jgi:hypothetical protein